MNCQTANFFYKPIMASLSPAAKQLSLGVIIQSRKLREEFMDKMILNIKDGYDIAITMINLMTPKEQQEILSIVDKTCRMNAFFCNIKHWDIQHRLHIIEEMFKRGLHVMVGYCLEKTVTPQSEIYNIIANIARTVELFPCRLCGQIASSSEPKKQQMETSENTSSVVLPLKTTATATVEQGHHENTTYRHSLPPTVAVTTAKPNSSNEWKNSFTLGACYAYTPPEQRRQDFPLTSKDTEECRKPNSSISQTTVTDTGEDKKLPCYLNFEEFQNQYGHLYVDTHRYIEEKLEELCKKIDPFVIKAGLVKSRVFMLEWVNLVYSSERKNKVNIMKRLLNNVVKSKNFALNIRFGYALYSAGMDEPMIRDVQM